MLDVRNAIAGILDRYTLADLANPGTGTGGKTVLRRMPRPKALA